MKACGSKDEFLISNRGDNEVASETESTDYQANMDTAKILSEYYDLHLKEHGDTAQGAAWPDEAGRVTRFAVGLEIIFRHCGQQQITLCDLGCGTGELYRYIRQKGLTSDTNRGFWL